MPVHVTVVDPTSPVGREVLNLLFEERFPLSEVRLLGTGDAVGESVDLPDGEGRVEELSDASFRGTGLAFFPSRELAVRYVPAALRAGAAVIDLGDSFLDALLVSPLVDPAAVDAIDRARGKVLSLPSASAAQLAAVLRPIGLKAGLVRVHVVSLEAVSGAGREGVDDLSTQTVALLGGREPEDLHLPQRVAFNIVPQVGIFEGDATTSERRTEREVRRLLAREIPISLTSLTVPVFYGHTQVLTVETEKPISAAEARAVLVDVARLLDDPAAGVLPGPSLAVGDDALHVGRVRQTPLGLALVSVADNVRWGAAVPAVKLALRLQESGKL